MHRLFYLLLIIIFSAQVDAALFDWDDSIFSPSDFGRTGKVLLQQGSVDEQGAFHPSQESIAVAVKDEEGRIVYLSRPFRDFHGDSLRVFDGKNIIPLSPVSRKIETGGYTFPVWVYLPVESGVSDLGWVIDIEDPKKYSQPRWWGASVWDSLPYYEYSDWAASLLVASTTILGAVKDIFIPDYFLPPFHLGSAGNIVTGYFFGEYVATKLQRTVGLFSAIQIYNKWFVEDAFVAAVKAVRVE